MLNPNGLSEGRNSRKGAKYTHRGIVSISQHSSVKHWVVHIPSLVRDKKQGVHNGFNIDMCPSYWNSIRYNRA